jgi:O-antigen ligase
VIAASIAVRFWRHVIGDLRFAIEKDRASKTSQSSERLPSASSLHLFIPALLTTFIAIVCLYALRASGSRGGLLGAGAAIFVMALALLKHPMRWLGAIVLVGLTLYTFGVVDLPTSFEQQLRDYGNIDVRTAHVTPITFSTIERLAHWQAAIRMAQANPWLGVGYGNYDAAYATYKLLQWDNSLGHAHNTYLNLLAETGAIGFVAYCVLWATIFVVTIRLVRHSSFIEPLSTYNFQHSTLSLGLLGAWAHFSAHNFFDNLFVANIHILIGVYLGLLIRHRNDNARHERLNI